MPRYNGDHVVDLEPATSSDCSDGDNCPMLILTLGQTLPASSDHEILARRGGAGLTLSHPTLDLSGRSLE